MEVRARWLVERLAIGLQATQLIQFGTQVATAFIRTRMTGDRSGCFGTLPSDIDHHLSIGRDPVEARGPSVMHLTHWGPIIKCVTREWADLGERCLDRQSPVMTRDVAGPDGI